MTLMTFISDYLPIIAAVVVFGGIGVPILFEILFKNRHLGEVQQLNKKTIIDEMDVMMTYGIMAFLLMFMCVGVVFFGMFLEGIQNNTTTDNIIAMIIMSMFIFVPLISIINLNPPVFKVMRGKYVIVEDILADKRMVTHSENPNSYYLYFQNYFKIYNHQTTTTYFTYMKSEIGDKFYLVFCGKEVLVFRQGDYILDMNEREKVVDINHLEDYIRIEKHEKRINKEEKLSEIEEITKNILIEECKKTPESKNAYIVMGSILLILLIIAVLNQSFVGVAFFVYILWVCIKGVNELNKKIKTRISKVVNNEFGIICDYVDTIGEDVDFSSSNEYTSLKFKNTKYLEIGKIEELKDAHIGDEYYLVYLNGEKEPLAIYNAKYTKIGSDISVR